MPIENNKLLVLRLLDEGVNQQNLTIPDPTPYFPDILIFLFIESNAHPAICGIEHSCLR